MRQLAGRLCRGVLSKTVLAGVLASACGGPVDHDGPLRPEAIASTSQGISSAPPPCGTVLATYNGTHAFSNGGDTGTGYSCGGAGTYGLNYQCVELVNRYYITHGLGARIWGNAGSDMCNNAAGMSDYLVYWPGSHVAPQPGDALEWEDSSNTGGHTAVVTGNSNGWITFIQQNVGTRSTYYPTDGVSWNGSTFGWYGGLYPKCWIRPRRTSPPPPPTCGGTPASPAAPTQEDRLLAGQGLLRGQSIHSDDGRFALVMQGDGNLVAYSDGVPLWASGTSGKGGYVAVMQGDGNLVVYSNTSCPLWASHTSGHGGAWLALQADGNVALYDASGHTLWASGTAGIPPGPTTCGAIWPGHGLAPGQSVPSCSGRYRLAMQGDGNLVLYHNGVGPIWASNTVGTPFRWAIMQGDGNFVLYTEQKALWSTATYSLPGAWLAVQDDGDLVVYRGNVAAWASNTAGR